MKVRKKYGKTQIDIFYDTDHGRFQYFSKLLENFEAKLGDFKQYSAEIGKTIQEAISKPTVDTVNEADVVVSFLLAKL